MPQNAKAAAGDRGDRNFRVLDWKPLQRATLQGFFSITTPSGLIIKDLSLHQRGEDRWVSFPGKPFKKADGSAGYINLVDFESKDLRQKFQALALHAIDAFIRAGGGHGN